MVRIQVKIFLPTYSSLTTNSAHISERVNILKFKLANSPMIAMSHFVSCFFGGTYGVGVYFGSSDWL